MKVTAAHPRVAKEELITGQKPVQKNGTTEDSVTKKNVLVANNLPSETTFRGRVRFPRPDFTLDGRFFHCMHSNLQRNRRHSIHGIKDPTGNLEYNNDIWSVTNLLFRFNRRLRLVCLAVNRSLRTSGCVSFPFRHEAR